MNATHMSDEENLTVVLGDRFYRVERPWGRVPPGVDMSPVSQLALDSAGRVYVYRRADPPVLVFEPSGEFAGGLGEGRICDAHGICITPDDRVFLVDRDAHQILVFTLDGAEIGALGERHRPRLGAPFNHPTDVAIAADGEVYVADGYGNSQVHRFSSTFEHIGTWGTPGVGPGEFATPHGIWVDRSDRVLLTDRENDRVQVFDREGRYLDEWGDLDRPMDIYEDARGMIFVTDCIPRLNMFSPEGSLVGRCRPTWNAPHGVWGNAGGDLFLAEQMPDRVTKLTLLEHQARSSG